MYCILKKKFWEELITYFPRKRPCNVSFSIAFVLVAAITFLPSLYTHTDTDWWAWLMKYAAEVGSGALIYSASHSKVAPENVGLHLHVIPVWNAVVTGGAGNVLLYVQFTLYLLQLCRRTWAQLFAAVITSTFWEWKGSSNSACGFSLPHKRVFWEFT
jgi:hypothetical protein